MIGHSRVPLSLGLDWALESVVKASSSILRQLQKVFSSGISGSGYRQLTIGQVSFCTVGNMLFECSAYGVDPSFAREEECILSDMPSLSSCEGGRSHSGKVQTWQSCNVVSYYL